MWYNNLNAIMKSANFHHLSQRERHRLKALTDENEQFPSEQTL